MSVAYVHLTMEKNRSVFDAHPASPTPTARFLFSLGVHKGKDHRGLKAGCHGYTEWTDDRRGKDLFSPQ